MKLIRRIGIMTFGFVVLFVAGDFLLSKFYVVPIVMYHHVADVDEPPSDTVTPEIFQKQINFLKSRGYHVIVLAELVKLIKAGAPIERNTVAITFDDGYADNYTEAFKILKDADFAATFFISPKQIGTKSFLTWEQALEMQANGQKFGSHGISQAYLPDLEGEELDFEIKQSKQILEERLKTQINIFAYPVGGFNAMAQQALARAGYEAAVTTNRGNDRWNKELFELNRVRFSNKDQSRFVMWAKLSGYYNLFRSLKNPY